MPHLSRRTFLELASTALISGCGTGRIPFAADSAPFLAFSDIHFNPFYTNDPKVFQALDAADASQWQGIFESAGITAPSLWGTDTNYPLLKLALASIRQNLGASPVAIYTGDLLGHQIATLYQKASGSSNQARMQSFTDKTAAFVMQQIRAAVGDIPVLFAVGNCDSYTGLGPDTNFLASNAQSFYSQMLNGAASRTEFMATFTAAGNYTVNLFGGAVMAIGLNTMLCSPYVVPPYVPGARDNSAAVGAQFAWLDLQLAAAQAAGQKVWILMHVPVGGFLGQTATPPNIDSSGHIASAYMMWIDSYQTAFMTTIAKYPGLVSMMMAGHTHMDEYRIVMPGYTLEIAPGISPAFLNDPAYKRFTLSLTSFAPTDYQAMKYSLEAPVSPTQFQSYYTFTHTYDVPNYSSEYLEQLFPKLASDPATQALFRQYYFSGNNSGNSSTNLTWPVYWSGVGNMSEQELVAAVNAY
jgi:sphingomyelin phosphodiesterase acid-like 3